MANALKKARVGALVMAAGALTAAAVLPGAASAQSTGEAQARVTRAVLLQADAANEEVTRATLVTQISVDGQGEVALDVPVVEGSSPKYMDSFGSPSVEDGQAKINLAADGPKTIRTSQTFDPADVPVELEVTATLDGQPINPTELSGASGVVELTYTARNLTSEAQQLTYQGADGKRVREEVEVPTAMGGTLEAVFPPSWTEITSEAATTISGDGTGNTRFSAGYTLFPPFGETEQTITIQARVTDGAMPPVTASFAILQPQENPTARNLTETLRGAIDSGQSIYDGGVALEDGLTTLQEGLITASDGASQIADGVSGTLQPGVNELNNGVQTSLVPGVNQLNQGVQNDLAPGVDELVSALAGLGDTVRASDDFAQVTDGFDTIRSAVGGVRDGLGVYMDRSSQKPGPWVTDDGDIDTDRANTARSLWALVYGARQQDVPTDRDNRNDLPNTNNGGLTNPDCDIDEPKDPANPCGAFQIIDAVANGLEGSLLPGLTQLFGGLGEIGAKLKDTESGGAFAVGSLAEALGCEVTSTPNGPIVDPATGFAGNPCAEPISVGGSESCPNPFQDQLPGVPALPCNLLVNALLGGVNLTAPLPEIQLGGLSQSLFNPLQLEGTSPSPESGLAAVLGQFYPLAFNAAVKPGIVDAAAGLRELNGVITTEPDGSPDLDTVNNDNGRGKTTATGIVMQLRASLSEGGVGKTLYPAGRCQAFATPGDPSSGLNSDATTAGVQRTCSAADVLNAALLGTDALEEGVSFTLLDGISNQLVEGVQPLQEGVSALADGTQQLADGVGPLADGTQQLADGLGPLADGTRQLADGLPAAVDGTGRLIDEGARELKKGGAETAGSYASQVALVEAMNSQEKVDPFVPGGAPTGDALTGYNGVYVYQLAGVGSSSGTSTGANFALGALGLGGAAAAAGLLAARRRAGG